MFTTKHFIVAVVAVIVVVFVVVFVVEFVPNSLCITTKKYWVNGNRTQREKKTKKIPTYSLACSLARLRQVDKTMKTGKIIATTTATTLLV